MSGPIVVPMEQLSHDALIGLVDAFVLREGTEYGRDDVGLEDKRRQVLGQLEREEVKIVFDPALESCTLVLARDLP